MPISKPPYSAQFREQMVELVRAGRKPSALALEFGCQATSIQGWVRQANAANSTAPADTTELSQGERQELTELRRKYRQVQMERDILAKATAWFANNADKTSTPSTR